MFQWEVGVQVAHPGIANDFNDEDAKKYYRYYQWVFFSNLKLDNNGKS